MNFSPKLFFVVILAFIISCNEDESPTSFPRTYTFDTYETSEYKEYLIGTNDSSTVLPNFNYELETEALVLDGLAQNETALSEFELLSDEEVRVEYKNNGLVVFDSIFTYRMNGDFIDVSIFGEFGDRFLLYDDQADEFYTRYSFTASQPGPNVVDPAPFHYRSADIEGADYESVDDHLAFLISEFDYLIGDTIIVSTVRGVFN